MRLTELLNKDEVTISCELFPPKQGAQLENYKNIVKDMAALKPAYMSVTYGATGGTSDYTVKLAEEVRNNNIPALAHLTCASSTKEKVASVIEELKAANIENILALRGDIPANADFPLPDQYKHASELIADIKAQGDFCIGGACYPEGHPEAATIFEDLDHLKEKVDAGCELKMGGPCITHAFASCRGKRLWKSMVLQADLSVRHTARRYSACCKKSGASACHRLFIWVEGQHPCHSSYFIYNDIPPILQVFMSTWCDLWYFQPVFTLPLRD